MKLPKLTKIARMVPKRWRKRKTGNLEIAVIHIQGVERMR